MEEVLLVSSKSDSLSSLPVDEEDCDSFWNSSKTGKANFFSSKKDNSKKILGTKIVICYYLLLSLLRKNPEKRPVVIYVILIAIYFCTYLYFLKTVSSKKQSK